MIRWSEYSKVYDLGHFHRIEFLQTLKKNLVIFPSRSTRIATQLSSFKNPGPINKINNFQHDQQPFLCYSCMTGQTYFLQRELKNSR